MEGLPNGSANVINTSAASYPSHSAVSQHSIQHHHHQSSGVTPQTLPPLQPSNPVMQQPPSYASYPPHPPRTSSTPNTPGTTNNMNNSYPPPPQQSAGRGTGYPIMSNNPYPPQPYPGASSTMLPQATTASSHPQPIAPAPSPGVRAPPVLRPMPASGVMSQGGMPSPYGQSPLMPQNSMIPEGGDQPTHVVGSQGRRGILPSAPGRPAAPAAGTSQAKNQIPQKDADGKFPCPHCTKTYLHAKHLKRHLLRHTGDRPYMCVLCRDTFSRSDILKRHFIKCSVRRGNPTGASHLSHPQAHVKKNAAAQAKAMGGEGDANHIHNGMNNMSGEGMVHPFGLIPASDGMNNIPNDQSQLSRSSSINRIDDANRDRRSMTGSVMGASTRPGSFDQTYNSGEVANINPQLANYSMPQNQNGMPMFAGSNTADWSQMFPSGSHHHPPPRNVYYPNNEKGQRQTAIKPEPNRSAERAAGNPGDAATYPTVFPTWGISSPSYSNAYEQLSSKLIRFLDPQDTNVTSYLQPGYIQHFLDGYFHFHAHFPFLHVPTFRVLDAHVSLVAAMCCIGACYSHSIPAVQTRELMTLVSSAVENSSLMFLSVSPNARFNVKFDWSSFNNRTFYLEEFQAILLVQILFTWHGSAVHREKAQRNWHLLASLARNAKLLYLLENESFCSPVHQAESGLINRPAINQFDWSCWIEQEKRIRTMYLIFMHDVTLGLYFHQMPQLDPLEIHLPLPADDAVWNATTSLSCAETLGLCGHNMATSCNPGSTHDLRRPGFRSALTGLLDHHSQMQYGSINLYGKLIIIHALLHVMRQSQLRNSVDSLDQPQTSSPVNGWSIGSGGAPTPNDSARATPVDVDVKAVGAQMEQTLLTALETFKMVWDWDIRTQLPSSVGTYQQHELSKNGIYLYWLAKHLVNHTRVKDLRMTSDQRCVRIMSMLKWVKSWVMMGGGLRREELESLGTADEGCGVGGMTLDLTTFFQPLRQMAKSPGYSTARAQGATGSTNKI
ncbi:respiration factor 2 [Cladorrhinum sp. PSN332]|nr:respiration factor 2 [Cladorrhinum sp. PSN332]